MERWGSEPWANRAAAYWLAELLNRDAVQRVSDALGLDVVEFHDEIRAAAALLLHLDCAGCWPRESADTQLALALSRLEEIQNEGLYAPQPATRQAVALEILALRERLALAVARP